MTEKGVVATLSDGNTNKIVDNSKSFADVPASYWGFDAVAFATSHELFSGTSATTFSPDDAMTRAMIVTVLASCYGVDTTTGQEMCIRDRMYPPLLRVFPPTCSSASPFRQQPRGSKSCVRHISRPQNSRL